MRFLAILAFATVLGSHLLAADWTQFRGPTAQGHADGPLPYEWNSDKNVAWKVALPGKGWSSPVASGGRIYLTAAVPTTESANADQSLRALCLDSKDGKILWNVEVFTQEGKSAPRIHTKNSHASPTPTIVGNQLIVHFGHQGIACLDATTGAKIWTNRELAYKPVHGNGGSPVVAGKRIYFSIDGTDRREVLALDRETGKVDWKFPRPQPAKRPFSFSTPLLTTLAGKPMLVSAGSDVVNGLDLESGKELWSLVYDGYSVVPRPVAGQGLVFLSTGYDTPSFLAIRVETEGSGLTAKIAWQSKEGAPRNASPLLVGENLFLVSDDGIATCRDAKTGTIHWKERIPGAYSSSLIYAGGLVYFQNEAGLTTVVKAAKTHEVVASNDLKERTLASHGVDGGALLIRTEKHLYKIGK